MKREESYFEKGKDQGNFSLLHPPGRGGVSAEAGAASGEPLFLELSPSAAHDLGLDEIVAAFTSDRAHQREIQDLFLRLPRDPAVIAYRQAVLDDLLANPALAERLASMLPVMDSLYGTASGYRSEREMPWLHGVVQRAGELQNIIDCFEGMAQILRDVEEGIRSAGLRALHEQVRRAQDDPTYQNLARELPELLARLRSSASITVGVNLDDNLRPVQATLLAVHDKPFTDQTLLNRLFGIRTEREGIAPLHSVPKRSLEGPFGSSIDPMLVPLFADLASVLEKTAIPIADRLKQYAGVHGGLFTELRQALIFYLGAIRFIRRFETLGLEMCKPEIAPAGERRCEVRNSYNVHLLLRHANVDRKAGAAIIRNDLFLGREGHILILTGPNHGGKTTYMQGVGVVHLLAQLGCYVPGTQAVISPLDHLFTHFPIEEKPELDAGRFGEEAMRLGKIFEQVTRHSLVLLNETLSSTSFSESLYLAQDIVRMLRRVGARAIYATHLHELANQADELNDSVPGESRIISVVSSPVETALQANGTALIQSYRLEIRPPLGRSYAREIAAHYGISYEQLEEVLSRRGVLHDGREDNTEEGEE